MKATLASRCSLCLAWIIPGEEVGALLGCWVHERCKRAEIARRIAAAGAAVEVPAVEPRDLQVVGIRSANRRSLNSLKRRKGR